METTYFYGPGTCALGGIIALEWLGAPYRLCRIDRETRRSSLYRRVHPQAKVPALQAAGRTLIENGAILTHLAERKPGLLPPHGTAGRDAANAWLFYLSSGLHAAYFPYFTPQRYAPYESLHPLIKETAMGRVRQELAYVDEAVGRYGYLTGPSKNLCDAYMFGMVRWAKFVDLPREYPRLAAWKERMESDPAVPFALATEREEKATSPSGAYGGHVTLGSLFSG
ncbi:MAG TPA: glutathione S-transferase N-terminal domain-containing protein [Myxococcota bacterium]|nr:glutathione S-transferase N-terminal domain-containing protein [Myxococcota bacterium]